MSELPIHLRKIDLFEDLDISTGEFYSEAQNVEDVISYAVSVTWSDGAILNAQMFLQASNDGENWTQIQQSTLSIAGASGTHVVNVEKPAYSFARLGITVSAGTATINSLYNAKRQ